MERTVDGVTYYRREQVPPEFQDLHILTGYRWNAPLRACLRSTLHFSDCNEAGNVWTHLVPALLLPLVLVAMQVRGGVDLIAARELPFTAAMLGSSVMFATSAAAHCFSSYSALARQFCFRCDYAAICVYAVSNTMAFAHYVWPWQHDGVLGMHAAEAYVLTMFILSTTACWVTCVSRSWGAVQFKARTAIFAIVYLVCVSPLCYRYILPLVLPIDVDANPETAYIWLAHLSLYAAGAAFNATKFPECKWPGKFDVAFGSHQWMHVCVAVAVCLNLLAFRYDAPYYGPALDVLGRREATVLSVFGPVLLFILLATAIVAYYTLYRPFLHIVPPESPHMMAQLASQHRYPTRSSHSRANLGKND